MMQARWGSHGAYEIIALCPNSPQECYDLTIRAFNMAEEYRVPVMMMMDECVGHMTEKVVIPKPEEIEITGRRYTTAQPGEYRPYFTDGGVAPPMTKAGDGHRFHVTGLTHDERGYPVMNPEVQETCVRRLVDKIRNNAEKIIILDESETEGADVIVVSYGITSRVSVKAIEKAREEGIKVGHLRLVTAWPFPEKRIRELAARTKAFIMAELNYGQMFFEMQRVIEGKAKSYLLPHGGGTVHEPEVIYRKIREAASQAQARSQHGE
jgi:2-oxoglutarate ferredoxin oxidoreductase subunit alpha